MIRGAYHRRLRPLTLVVFCLVSGCASGTDDGGGPTGPAWVGDARCATCHSAEAERWTGSDHDLAMQEAGPESVLGSFDGTEASTLTHFGVTSRFTTRDGRFIVNTEDERGELRDFEIAYTFGVEPLQQYLIEFPGGRLQALSIAWDTENARWFHLYPDEEIGPDDALHWTGPFQNWNFMCAECHSTHLEKNYDPETRTYETSWAVIDVSCEACHGPAGSHVRWAEDGGRGDDGMGLVVDFRDMDARDQVDACGVCHSRRRQISTDDVTGESFLDHFVAETLREGLYHADGQILDEVYVYGSFLQSRMYQEGVACTDCHDPHTLGLKMDGNGVCVQCHGPAAPPDRFPSLVAGTYDSPQHHFHPAGSAGAGCVNCHMPARTYMVVDPRRDHSFRIPRPDLTLTLGTPNACNDCHTDQTPEWAAGAIADWYGPGWPPHYGPTLQAGRNRDPEAAGALSALAMNADTAAIVRATALELVSAYGDDGLPALRSAVGDAEGWLRLTAAGLLPPEDQLRRLPALLHDPVRSVRLEAARLLAAFPPASVPAPERALLGGLISEYEAVQMSQADTAPARLNLGVLHTATGSIDRAVLDYQTALEIQPDFTPASLNLATLLNQLGRSGEAFLVLRDAIAEHPEEGEIHYSMGLLLAEGGQIEAAAESLRQSVALAPDRARMRYNYGLALRELDRRDEAETQLLEARRLGPDDPDVVQALAALYAQDERWDDAVERAEELVAMLPGDAAARQFLESIRREAAAR